MRRTLVSCVVQFSINLDGLLPAHQGFLPVWIAVPRRGGPTIHIIGDIPGVSSIHALLPISFKLVLCLAVLGASFGSLPTETVQPWGNQKPITFTGTLDCGRRDGQRCPVGDTLNLWTGWTRPAGESRSTHLDTGLTTQPGSGRVSVHPGLREQWDRTRVWRSAMQERRQSREAAGEGRPYTHPDHNARPDVYTDTHTHAQANCHRGHRVRAV